ncbi:MAG: hypothetical protein V2G48_07905, partial [bacterium JZ-2024 1]
NTRNPSFFYPPPLTKSSFSAIEYLWEREKDELPEIDFSLSLSRSNHLEGSFPIFLFPVSPESKKFSPFSLLPQKVEILRTDKKILPAKVGNSRNRHKKFCQQKVEIPKKRDEKILPLSSYPQNGGISLKRGTEKGKENHNEAVARIARKVEQKKGRSSE